jgi:hypothetical protein
MTELDRSRYETRLDADRHPHVGIWRDEHDDLTREFFDWNVPDLADPVREAIAAGVRTDLPGMNLDNVSDLLEPGYLPLETGLAHAASGEGCVAVWTSWPGTTPEMIDWWFGWHIARTERYKLWHPQAHYYAQPKYDLSDLPGLTDRERYLGNTSWVDEYIGPIDSRLAISFHDPAVIGLDYDTLDAAGYGTLIYATSAMSDDDSPGARLIHAVRRTAWGSEMRSRFILPPGILELIGPPLLDHCYTEMTHLAGFLPRLFARVNATGP